MPHSSTQSSVLKYIPQRPPFVLVDELLHCDLERTETKFRVEKDNLFIEKEHFTETGILENIAQTCAVRLGYLNRNQPVKIGMVGSVDNFELYSFPKIGDVLNTTIIVKTEIMNVVLLEANVVCNDQKVAFCNMKVVLTDIAVTE